MYKVPGALSWLVTIESGAAGVERSSPSAATVSEETPQAVGPQMMRLMTPALHKAHQSGPHTGAKVRLATPAAASVGPASPRASISRSDGEGQVHDEQNTRDSGYSLGPDQRGPSGSLWRRR